MSKFQKGDRVRFADNEYNRTRHNAVVGRLGTVTNPGALSFGVSFVRVLEDVNGRDGGWYEHQLELVSRTKDVFPAAEPACPNCGKKAAPEHVADGKARCWWCENRWTLPVQDSPMACLKSGAAVATVHCRLPGYTARITGIAGKHLPDLEDE